MITALIVIVCIVAACVLAVSVYVAVDYFKSRDTKRGEGE
jgi:hypothetical protein